MPVIEGKPRTYVLVNELSTMVQPARWMSDVVDYTETEEEARRIAKIRHAAPKMLSMLVRWIAAEARARETGNRQPLEAVFLAAEALVQEVGGE